MFTCIWQMLRSIFGGQASDRKKNKSSLLKITSVLAKGKKPQKRVIHMAIFPKTSKDFIYYLPWFAEKLG